MSFHVIIPARMASTRLPQKPLHSIAGYPMIVHTAKRGLMSDAASVTVCTDHHRIHWVCRDHGLQTVDTHSNHVCGTDRCNEAADKLGLADDDIIVVVLGDEPFVRPEWINTVGRMMETTDHPTIYPYQYCNDIGNVARIKVAVSNGRVLFMSRYDIPMDFRKERALKKCVNVIGFRRKTLRVFAELGEGEVEHYEGIEMMRLLEANIDIGTCHLSGPETFTVDVPADLERANQLMPDYDVKW